MVPQFFFNSGQRKGIVALIFILLLLVGITCWQNQKTVQEESDRNSLTEQQVRKFIDSLKAASGKENRKDTIYPFNPNYITDYKGYTLGMSVEEIDRLLTYRKADKWINSAADFQRVTGVSDSLLARISPSFRFPDWVQQQSVNNRLQTNPVPAVSFDQKEDLNKATADDLLEIEGIEKELANRIVSYRKKIGGFMGDVQLRDVFGLKYDVRRSILNRYTVQAQPDIKPLNINEIGVAELTEIVYIDYELARKIVAYRQAQKRIQTLDELQHIEGFPTHRLEQIKLYLKAE